MAKIVDLRTYLLLERAFVRRLQRSWRQQSAPTYAKITQACLDHHWDEARRLVGDLDMTEVGTENREWITYMFLSCAVFGANTVAKGKPSFVGVGTFDTFLKQVTTNFLQYLEHRGTQQVQAEALQSIAEDEAKTKALALKWDESKHPRGEGGRFVDAEGVTHVGEFVELYHGTSKQRANKILKEGFKIRAVPKQTMGGDPESNRNYIWLAKRMASAKSYSEMHRNPTVLTVLLPKALYEGLKRSSGPDSVWSREPIPAKYVRLGATKWDEHKHPRDVEGQFTEAVAAKVAKAAAIIAEAKADGRPVLFHSGDASIDDQLAQGIEPRFGAWLEEVLSGATDEDELANQIREQNPITFFSTEPSWVAMKAARAIGKHVADVTMEDIQKHGQLSIISVAARDPYTRFTEAEQEAFTDEEWAHQESLTEKGADPDDFLTVGGRHHEEVIPLGSTSRGFEEIPFGVEPKDIFSKNTVVPDVTLTGEALVTFLQAHYPQLLSRVKKWDEHKHPRDKEGQFTGTGTISEVKGVNWSGYHWGSDFTEPDDFYYHVTLRPHADQIIQNQTLLPGAGGFMGRAEPEAHSRGRVFLTDRDGVFFWVERVEQHAADQYDHPPRVSVIRIPKSAVPQAKPDPAGTRDAKSPAYFVDGPVKVEKWDESKHPRDKQGQFTEAGYLRDVEGRTGMEGGEGPEREKWEKLNDAVMDATDEYFTAKEVHQVRINQIEGRYAESDPEFQKRYDDPDYLESQARLQEAQKKVTLAEAALKQQEPAMKKEVVANLAAGMAVRLGIDPSIIDVVHHEPTEFTVGEKQFKEAGHFDPSTGRIELNAYSLPYGDAATIKGLVAHEVSHVIYHAIKKAGDEEFNRYLSKATTPDGQEHSDWYWERFEIVMGERQLKPAYREEFAREFPAAMAMSILSGGEPFTGIATGMIRENGHSEYAKSYWTKEAVAQRGDQYGSAINETIAEVTRYLVDEEERMRGRQGTGWHEDKKPSPNSPWVKLTQAMHKWYTEGNELRRAGVERLRASQQYHPLDAKGRKYGEPGYNT